MSRYTLSHLAQEDLDGIWDYIANDNPNAADRYTLKLCDQFQTLAREPGIGRLRPEFVGGKYRSFPVGRYLIFYEAHDNHIQISRILHGSRNLPDLFG